MESLIWALDAFDTSSELLGAAVKALRKLEPLGLAVKPVYILTPGEINLSTEFIEYAQLPIATHYRPAALKALNELLSRVNIAHLLPAEVIALENSSTHQAAEALSNYALQNQARAIIVSSHGRSGFGRLILGSFAETLLFKSEVPVLVVHPHQSTSEKDIKKILFPTDFGPVAEGSFRSVVDLAKKFGATIKLFHSIPSPVEPVFQSGVYLLGGGWMPVHEFLGNEVERRQKRADAWSRWALKTAQVKVETYLNTAGGGISDFIVNLAESEDFDLVAMAAQSGALGATLIGSIARQVVRHAPCPVWVIRFEKKRAHRIVA
jgi:nucleotide-binding universal stress UspA family protein